MKLTLYRQLLILILTFISHIQFSHSESLATFCNRRSLQAHFDYLSTASQFQITIRDSAAAKTSIADTDLEELNHSLIRTQNKTVRSLVNSFLPKRNEFEIQLRNQYPHIYYASYFAAISIHFIQGPVLNIIDRSIKRNILDDDNSLLDAHRHIMWAARLTQLFGPEMAQCLLLIHEGDLNANKSTAYKNLQYRHSHYMDLINNQIGIHLGINKNLSLLELHTNVLSLIGEGKAYVLNPWNLDIVPSTAHLQLFQKYLEYR